jgi:hypothetical protein
MVWATAPSIPDQLTQMAPIKVARRVRAVAGSSGYSSVMTDKHPEPDPDAWQRFERAVDAALHTPAQHRKPKDKPESSREPKPK